MLMQSGPGRFGLDDPADTVIRGHDRSTAAKTADGGAALDLPTLWLILRWRARLIAGITMATIALAVAALLILPQKYQATTIVLVDPRDPHVTDTPAVLAGIGSDAAAVESQVEIIQSSTLVGKVVNSLNLASDPEFAMASIWESLTGSLFGRDRGAIEQTRQTRLIYKFRQSLTVVRRGLTYVIEISFTSQDPAKAARIANAVAEAYLADQRDTQGNMNARASEWLDSRIGQMRETVRRSDEAVQAYRSAHNIIDVTQGNNLVNRQIEDLTQQIALSRTRTADAKARLERVEQVAQKNFDPATLNEALQSQVISNLRTQYAEAARLEAEYSTIYGERYPGLRSIRAQLGDLRRQIGDEIGRILVGVRNDYQTAVSRETSLERDLEKLKLQFATLNQADVQLRELERESQANRAVFEQFLNRAKQTTEQQTLQIAGARIVSPALPPMRPNRPGTLLLLFVSACGGIILAIGSVLVLEQTRQSFRSLREVTRYLSVPGLGMLPDQFENDAEPRGWLDALPIPLAARIRSPASSPAPPAAPSFRFACDQPGSPYTKNLRAIRNRLLQSEMTSRDKIVAVVSALPGEGKSTFACNFGFAAADAGLRTLLIDGDIYGAATSRLFGLKGAGLFEVLENEISLADAVSEDAATRLHVLGARRPSTPAAELPTIDAERLGFLLRDCRKQFDLIVLDSPAILPVGDITPHIECADSAVMVVEWDHTARRAAEEALDMMDLHALKVAGVVLNKVSARWCRLFDPGKYLQLVEMRHAA